MKMINKNEFLKRSTETLNEIVDMLLKLESLNLKDLQIEKTALVMVDMINGFTREGALKSPRIEGLIPEIVALSKLCDEHGIKKLAFADCHNASSPEFESYPPHCMAGTFEREVVSEIKEVGGYSLILKNSTNGFLEEEFRKWLSENQEIDTFIIAGGCTDICIQQFAITLKTWFNMNDRKSRIIVPVNIVETYDMGTHNADLINVMSLFNMITNGVEVVKEVI